MKLPKEYEHIVITTEQTYRGRLSALDEVVRAAVEACYALASRPPKELTEAEITDLWGEYYKAGAPDAEDIKFIRRIIHLHVAKQRWPEVIKFRAARHKYDGSISMLKADYDMNGSTWEWLDDSNSPQEIEVKL